MLSALYPKKVKKMIDLAFLLAPAVNVYKVSGQWTPVFTYGNIVGVWYQIMIIACFSLFYFQKLLLKLNITSLFRQSLLITQTIQFVCINVPYFCRFLVNILFGKTDQLLSVRNETLQKVTFYKTFYLLRTQFCCYLTIQIL